MAADHKECTPQTSAINETAEEATTQPEEPKPEVPVVVVADSTPDAPALVETEEVRETVAQANEAVADAEADPEDEDAASEADEEDVAVEANTKDADIISEPETHALPRTPNAPLSAPATTPPEQSQQPPRLRKRSSRSFPNLMGRELETISDNEADSSDMEIQQQFWSRAMKPSKSGPSTPHTPARRKSVVEISNQISSEDLAAWMHWRDSTSPVRDPESEVPAADTADQALQLLTPPVSKGSNAGAIQVEVDQEEDVSALSSKKIDALSSQDGGLRLSIDRADSKDVAEINTQAEAPVIEESTATTDEVAVSVALRTK
ncbi:hypothetical protein FBU59_006611 [Linderina macrospora]|uniref:Uncharacterized protein n=1 Tax=Linderina macrospora TaxID=4868 RepID=A0ACC1IZL2_9FUNG|nr:hypothetical protein FBU59_006611 [Linderina macrospora]